MRKYNKANKWDKLILSLSFAALGVGFVILGILVYRQNFQNKINDTEIPSVPQICLDETCFDLEIADDREERMTWLMMRENMPEYSGMLFVFDISSIYGFWMKNTLIPLDMIWLDQYFKVVAIKTAVPCKEDPCPSYNPEVYATYVLEVNAWMAEKIGLEVWDTLIYKK